MLSGTTASGDGLTLAKDLCDREICADICFAPVRRVLHRHITDFSDKCRFLIGGPVVPAFLAALITAIPWLTCAFVCCLVLTYVAAVLMALLHSDPRRRADARAVLDRHAFTVLRRHKS